MIKNRIEKNLKKLSAWSERHKIEAFRVYDRDIPEYPYIVDKYGPYLVIYEKLDFIIDQEEKKKHHKTHLEAALMEIFKVPVTNVIWKRRQQQKGESQYERIDKSDTSLMIQETQARFKVNLWDYLDTGLFLDHRPMRQIIYKNSKQKNVLNLFCYTGSVSVFAALGGGTVTSVDMSQTYIEWAKENFLLNEIPIDQHRFVCMNALEFLYEFEPNDHQYDLIFLDPPTFSNSKKMQGTFEVERDQVELIHSCMAKLKPDGTLYFSNNKRKFTLDPSLLETYFVKDITEKTIPIDFHDQKIHHCYEIKNLKK